MNTVTTVEVYCDEPGCQTRFVRQVRLGTEARALARQEGWEYYKYSDYCPEHNQRPEYIEPWQSVWRRREAEKQRRGGET